MVITYADATTLGTLLEGIFHGGYIVLFTLYLILRRRNTNRVVDGPLVLAQILLFGFCNTSLCLDIVGAYFAIPDVANTDAVSGISIASLAVYMVIDYLAQMTLLYRCWIVWGRRWTVVAIPGLFALAALGVGLAFVGLANTPFRNDIVQGSKFARLYGLTGIMTFSMSLSTNAITTSLIIIKIVLTSRELRPPLGSTLHRPLRIVIAMLIESGLFIFTLQLVFVILFSSRLAAFYILAGPITQAYGIIPTLISIRVIMGSAYDKTTEKTRSLRFAHSRGAATQTTGLSVNTAGARSRGIITELDYVSDSERTAGDAV